MVGSKTGAPLESAPTMLWKKLGLAVVDAVRTALGDASVDALDGCDCESDVLGVGAATGVGGVGGVVVVELADAPPDAEVVLVLVLVLAAPASVVGLTVLTVSSDDDDVL